VTKLVTGINIQYPISNLILAGEKKVETRTYQMPEKYIGCELAIVETPGKSGNFKARLVGTIMFGKSFRYKSKTEFYRDTISHRVTPDSPWRWSDDKPKWGWPILRVTRFKKPRLAPLKKGIKFTHNIEIY
jgi:hypothetical protein